MVFAGVPFADGGFHEAREGREDIDWGVYTFVVELAIDEDLAFGDVAREVGDGVGDVYVFVMLVGFLERRGGGWVHIPSLGMVRMGIWVMDPLRPSTRPARS